MKKLNRVVSFLMAAMLLLNLLPAIPAVRAEDGNITWTVEDGVMTVSGTGPMWPEDEPMPDDWPDGEDITAVVVEEGITSVADFAFEEFLELTTVTLADSVESVGYEAFEGCVSLKEVRMPYGIHVNKDAFANSRWLDQLPRDEQGFVIYQGILLAYEGEEENIEIPDSVVSVAGDFTDVDLCSVVIPDSVTILGDYAFYGQDDLEEVNFPDSLRYIGGWAFESAGLTEAILPESLEYLGKGAFAWCDKLTKASIPDGLEYLGDSVFQWCTALENVTLGEGIDGITDYMFYYCDSLESVEIPGTVTYIGYEAFGRCYELKEIVIPVGVTFIDYSAFWDCWNLTTVVLPEGLKNVNSSAFDGCHKLQQMNLPDSLETFDAYGLENTPWIQNRYDANGYAVEGQWLLSYRGSDTSVVIPESVKRIAGYALDACGSMQNITSLTLPGKLEYIGVAAFNGCSGLTELTIPDTVTFIDQVAFYGCSGLQSLVIPDSVTALNYATFAQCKNLSELTLSANLTQIPEDCFRGCESLQSVQIPDGVTSIGHWAFYDCSNMQSITIPASVTAIEDEAAGYYTDPYYWDYSKKIYGFTIYGYADSAAHTYAWVNGFTFVDLDEPVEHVHDYYLAEEIEPTCTEGGYTIFTCECGESYIDDYTDPLGHDWDVWQTVKAPTCTEAGLEERSCRACGETETAIIEALDHEWGEFELVKAPTCTEDGYEERSCWACGKTETNVFEAYGHEWSEWEIAEAPSCTENGSEERFCWNCGETETNVIEAHGHEWSQWEIVEEPTITTPGLKTRTCYICLSVESQTIPQLDHTHEYTAVVTAPTCTEQGFTTYTCECGESYVADYTDALGHDYADGLCTRCGAEDPDYEKPAQNPFTDVPAGSFYEAPVLWAVENGITNGASADSFDPNGQCMRAHVVTFLWRAAGCPEPASTVNPFADVKETDFYYKAVLWAVEKGITNGVDATHFGPFTYCNRAQVVTFLYRAMGSPEIAAAECPFTDVAPGAWFEAPILWAVENGITNGMGDGLFGVNTICNRAQVVTFLYRTYVN